MSQATYTPDVGHNDAAALSFFNNVFAAIASNNAGNAAPAETYPYMIWADTSGATVAWKVRNAANNGWGDLFKIATQAVAEAGTNNSDLMTALRVQQAIDAIPTPVPVGEIVAWVSFNGTGVPSIRASGNVSSITDVTTGEWIVNFATPLADANYAVSGIVERGGTNDRAFMSIKRSDQLYTTTQLKVKTQSDGGGAVDCSIVNVIVTR
jgi:hypothetical protein